MSAPATEANDDGEMRRPRRGRRPRRAEGETAGDEPQRIEMDRLPPAFSPAPESGTAAVANGHGDAGQDNGAIEPATDDAAPKRRRTRRVPKTDDDSSVAA